MKFTNKITLNLKKIFLLSTLILSIFISTINSTRTKRSKSLNKADPKLSVFNRRTPENDWGSNNIHFLDRHNVNCNPNEALQGFRLWRPASNKLSYRFACLENKKYIPATNFYEDQTKPDIISKKKNNSANYLDRHLIQCKEGYALQQFQLARSGPTDIYYKFRCVKVICGNIESMETEKKSAGGFETVYLDRQDIRVKENEVITGFKLISENSNFSYKVNFCKMTNEKPKIPEGVKNALKVIQNKAAKNNVTPIAPKTPSDNNPLPIKPKDLKIAGRNFCEQNCEYNPAGSKKKCQKNSQEFICRRCSVNKMNSNDNDKKMICEKYCDSAEGKESKCDFYGYMNNQRKNVALALLKKYGLELLKKMK